MQASNLRARQSSAALAQALPEGERRVRRHEPDFTASTALPGRPDRGMAIAVEEDSPLMAKLPASDPLIERRRGERRQADRLSPGPHPAPPDGSTTRALRGAGAGRTPTRASSRTSAGRGAGAAAVDGTSTTWIRPSRFVLDELAAVRRRESVWQESVSATAEPRPPRAARPRKPSLGRRLQRTLAGQALRLQAFLARLAYPAIVLAALACVPLTTWLATQLVPGGVDLGRSRCALGLWLLDRGVSFETAAAVGSFAGGCTDILIPAAHFGAMLGAVIDLGLLLAARFHTTSRLRGVAHAASRAGQRSPRRL